jgi:hypothetical protein
MLLKTNIEQIPIFREPTMFMKIQDLFHQTQDICEKKVGWVKPQVEIRDGGVPPRSRLFPRALHASGGEVARISFHVWTPPEGRGFSPHEIAAPTLCSSRTPRRLRLQATRGAGQGNNQTGLVRAGLKPRPSNSLVRKPGQAGVTRRWRRPGWGFATGKVASELPPPKHE